MPSIMQNLEITSLSKDNYQIKGELTFATINTQTINALNFKQASSPIKVDLQQIRKIDSAGLALLIEWLRFAQAHHTELQFKHIPTQLTALAKLSYLSETDLFTIKE